MRSFLPPCLALLLASAVVAQDRSATKPADGPGWHTWRGPDCRAIAPDADPPITWSEGEAKNIRFKVALPGLGTSSPIVLGARIYVTTAIETDRTGRGPARDAGGPTPTKVHEFAVLALDRHSGKVLWHKNVIEKAPHEGLHPTATQASHSPMTDGEHLYVYFGSRGLHCLDLAGEVQWSKQFGQMRTRHNWGEGSSPVIHGNTIVVNWDHEDDSFVVALDKRNGKELWRKPRDEVTSWSTPLIVEVDGGLQVIIAATTASRGYDLANGKVLWTCAGMTVNCIPTPIHANGLVYLMSGYRGNKLQAVRLKGATGDVAKGNNLVWTHDRSTSYVPSSLVYENCIYFLRKNSGVLSCLDATTGKPHFEGQRLAGIRSVYASPVGAAGRVYITSRKGTTNVFKVGAEYRELASNKLDDEFDATAAIVGDAIYLRGRAHLYCIAEKK